MLSKSDLERGYSDTGAIPDEFDNVFNPESVAEEAAEKKMLKKWGIEEEPEWGGFLGRDDCGYERI